MCVAAISTVCCNLGKKGGGSRHVARRYHDTCIIKYLAEIFLFILLTNDFSQNYKNVYHICMHVNSVLFCAYREKLECSICNKGFVVMVI